ncbi:hypothetical protein [Piscibacillus halophilus]|uniref:hypothetical protein n=1 Tax=Piscibacillus halophilus TaxID=571933 RepID=UPI00158BBEC5|nr:hypothetical protein [Piscibacillus halophilus]
MGFVLVLFSMWLCSFIVARLFSLVGGKWSPFGKTYWKNDLVICFAQALVITIIFMFFFENS